MAAVEHVTSPPIPWRWSARGLWRLLKLLAGALVSAVDYLSLNSNERRSRAGLARWLQRTCVRALAALRIEVRMPESFPAGVMLAPNHVSYLDILVISALSPTVFVAKAEVEGWPLFGWFARRAGTLFLRREVRGDVAKVGGQLAAVIEEGANLVVFLEGTSTDGTRVGAFKSSMLAPAVRGGWPVCPVALRYEVPPGHDASIEVAWWGTMPLLPHVIGVAGLPWVRAEVKVGPTHREREDRKTLARRLQDEVQAMLVHE